MLKANEFFGAACYHNQDIREWVATTMLYKSIRLFYSTSIISNCDELYNIFTFEKNIVKLHSTSARILKNIKYPLLDNIAITTAYENFFKSLLLLKGYIIHQVVKNLEFFVNAEISTLYDYTTEINNPNDVKVVTDDTDTALYFSRSAIPHGSYIVKRHIGVYAYRASFLKNFMLMKQCGLERLEKLEQLRAMYYGARIRLDEVNESPGHEVVVMGDIIKIIRELEDN